MRVQVWITVIPGADRPYFSHWPPNEGRKREINEKGGKVYKLYVMLPGFEKSDDGTIVTIAEPTKIGS